MKSHTRFILFAVLLFPSIAFCQFQQGDEKGKSYYTNGSFNGRFFEIMNNDQRTAYLFGVRAGVSLFSRMMLTENASGKVDMELWKEMDEIESHINAKGFSCGDITQQLESFYTDRSNIRIPIHFAYRYCVGKMNRESPQYLEQYLALLRKQCNE